MRDGCSHLDQIKDVTPSGPGCVECVAAGKRDWVHLRVCQECGHVGCCNDSPGKHATAHNRGTLHPVVRSYEPGEDWYYCYPDDVMFELEGAPPPPYHP
ncbi:MAG TPA: UBP-type zinc finger domain-containing protein [Candidatus Dormibacteraeota bacterium]|nr:UBP-type zinc finger domain-containing protein [Candidatus Dormibacteraeota bacterium]